MDSTDPNGLYPTLPRASEIIFGRKNPKPLRRARDRGELRVYKLGDRWERVYLPDVIAWVRSHSVHSASHADHARQIVSELLERDAARDEHKEG